MSDKLGLPTKSGKGALLIMKSRGDSQMVLDPDVPPLIFQYNPETITRTFYAPSKENGTEKSQQAERKYLVELINLILEFDALDWQQSCDIGKVGLHPVISILEKMIDFQINAQKEVLILSWGPNRTLPVEIVEARITEEAFDSKLNPIRLMIELKIKIKKIDEFKRGSAGYIICKNNLAQRETFIQHHKNNGQKNNDFETLKKD